MTIESMWLGNSLTPKADGYLLLSNVLEKCVIKLRGICQCQRDIRSENFLKKKSKICNNKTIIYLLKVQLVTV